MAEAYGPTSCSSSLALESTLSRSLEVQYGLVPKLCHQSAKTIALARLKTMSDYAQPVFQRAKRAVFFFKSWNVELETKRVFMKNKEFWKTVIQIIVTVLTALTTTLGVTSCM